jgi:ABC-2 type transport system permease protein
MRKYLSVFAMSWSDGFVYRLNFLMWRLRTLLQFFTVYFLWLAIFSGETDLFAYSRAGMLTYIFGVSVLRSFVLSSRSVTVGVEIANGDLNNYLLKPISYLKNWLARDLADKAINLIFMVLELGLLILLLRPPLLAPASLTALGLMLVTAVAAMFLYFLFSFLVSSITFWYTEHQGWPIRFITFMILEFLAGSLFPLDIFPESVFNVFRALPTAYFLFYPMQFYLGRVSGSEVPGILFMLLFWLVALYFLAKLVWKKGLKVYGAYGR